MKQGRTKKCAVKNQSAVGSSKSLTLTQSTPSTSVDAAPQAMSGADSLFPKRVLRFWDNEAKPKDYEPVGSFAIGNVTLIPNSSDSGFKPGGLAVCFNIDSFGKHTVTIHQVNKSQDWELIHTIDLEELVTLKKLEG